MTTDNVTSSSQSSVENGSVLIEQVTTAEGEAAILLTVACGGERLELLLGLDEAQEIGMDLITLARQSHFEAAGPQGGLA